MRSIQLADRVAAGEIAFLDAVDIAYEAAAWSGLTSTVGDDIVQATLAAAFANARRPMTELRPYQQDIIAKCRSADRCGQAAHHHRCADRRGQDRHRRRSDQFRNRQKVSRVGVAHTREIIKQTAEKLFAYDIEHGIVQAGFASRPWRRVQVASVQTLWARAMRTNRMELPPADLLIVDECHHCAGRHLPQDHCRLPQCGADRADCYAMPWRRPRAWRHLRHHH